jgi:hypothetical protein
MVKPPPVNSQGKAVVERGDGDDLLVMMPDGTVVVALNPKQAERKVKAWFKTEMNEDAINVGTIEWRNGIKPPV